MAKLTFGDRDSIQPEDVVKTGEVKVEVIGLMEHAGVRYEIGQTIVLPKSAADFHIEQNSVKAV